MTSSSTQHSEFKKKFGNRLRKLRESKDISIKQAVEDLGVSRTTYASWELGYKYPKALPMKKLAKYYKTNEAYLMQSSDDPSPINPDLKNLLSSVDTVTYKDKELSPEQIAALKTLLDAWITPEKQDSNQ